ncbi:hypothetical protein LOAG_12937, partial [Loa loa]
IRYRLKIKMQRFQINLINDIRKLETLIQPALIKNVLTIFICFKKINKETNFNVTFAASIHFTINISKDVKEFIHGGRKKKNELLTLLQDDNNRRQMLSRILNVAKLQMK